MSVVAVQILDDGYEIASDSICVRHSTQSKCDRGNLSKLVEVNNIVIGGVGNAEEVSLLMMFCETRRPDSTSEISILNFLGEFSEWKHKKTGSFYGGNNEYFICFSEKVFHILGWVVDRIKTFEAIGAGMDYALAAMHLGHNVESAVEVAIELSIYCEGPVNIIKKVV